jgi:hypothetical protein
MSAPPVVPAGTPAETDGSPSTVLAIGAVVVALVSAFVGARIFLSQDPNLHLNAEGFDVFAPVFFAAQAIERLLEPLSSVFLKADEQKDTLKAAREDKLRAQRVLTASLHVDDNVLDTPAAIQAVAATTDDERAATLALRQRRADRKLWFFMVATVIACVVSGYLGLGILEAMSTEQLTDKLGAFDVGLTGIVIGAGTKPLHDLIERVQKAKENSDAATKPTEMLPGTPGAGTGGS